MALSTQLRPTQTLTYADYMAEGEVVARYDIINGERIYMTQPTDRHQDIAANIFEGFRAYVRQTRRGRAKFAPCDILITSDPLKTRQPDVLLISTARYAGREPQSAYPYDPAPELVVEVLSPSETRRIQQDKIRDYCKVGVQECWMVSPEAETVEVLRITLDGPVRKAVYAMGEIVTSLAFPELSLALEAIFTVDE